MDEVTRAYIAGLFDGDGYVGFCLNTKRTDGKVDGLWITPKVGITTADLEFAEKIRETLGYGTVVKNGNGRKKPEYTVLMKNMDEALRFLEEVKPYIVYKKRRVELMEKYLRSRMTRRGVPNQPYTREELEIVEELRKLNGIKGRGTSKIEVAPFLEEVS